MFARLWKNRWMHRFAHLAYHHWYYDTAVWRKTTYLGVPCLKSVSDMWNYQEILHQLRPSLVIEFDTHSGGATLFFSHLLRHINAHSKVLTVDIDHALASPQLRADDHIECVIRSSTDVAVADRIRQLRSVYPGPAFVILDSDHSMVHVLNELRLLRDLLRRGDYVIVEDSNVNGHPVMPKHGPGPMEAIMAYFEEFPDDYRRDTDREVKFGFSFAPKGFLIRN